MRPSLLLVALCGACVAAEAPRAARSTPGPLVTAVDSVQLVESDSVFVGLPMAFGLDGSGDLYLSDAFSHRVLRFDRRGRLLTTYGRSGRGPGEFQTPAAITIVADSLVVVDDFLPRVLSVFDRESGAHRRSIRHDGQGASAAAVGDTVFLGALTMERGTGMAAWDLRTDSLTYFASVPAEYRQSRSLSLSHPVVFFARWADSLLVSYSGHQDLFLHTGARSVDTIDIPAIRRRGVPRDMVARFARDPSPEEFFGFSSLLVGLHRLSTGHVVAVYFDQVLEGPLVRATGHVSVVSPDFQSACVDGRLDVSEDVVPRIAMRGDTLVTVEQVMLGDQHAATIVRSHVLDMQHCTWLPLARRSASPT